MRKFLPFLILLLFSIFFLTGCVEEFYMNPPHKSIFQKEVNFSGEKSLNITCKSGVADLKIAPIETNSKKLFKLEVVYDDANQKLHYDFTGNDLTITLYDFTRNDLTIPLEGRKSSKHLNSTITLFVSKKVPVSFDIRVGVGNGNIDLTGLKVKSFNIKTGVGDTDIFCKEKNEMVCEGITIKNGVGDLSFIGLGNLNCKEFECTGGVGDCHIEVGDRWKGEVRGKVESGVGDVEIFFPESVAVEARVVGSKYTSSVSVDYDVFEKSNEHLYITRGFKEKDKKLYLKIVSGVGDVKIRVK